MSFAQFFHYWLVLSKVSALAIVFIVGVRETRLYLLSAWRGAHKGFGYVILRIIIALAVVVGTMVVMSLEALVPTSL